MARFLDSSVYLYAILKPRKELTRREKAIKDEAKAIISSLEEGEEMVTSTIHLSEILNMVESRLGLEKALAVLETFLSMDNLTILGVTRENYEEALIIAEKYNVSPNDAVAVTLCATNGIKEIYSFDKHFDNIPWIKRVTKN
ncbi:MAG: type II toxin-antitoxin system VapC family toxin [Thermoproteales archaeon]|nr:type II toxin-antitoxin system VapC family toxin [Thermoproteales archaeon]